MANFPWSTEDASTGSVGVKQAAIVRHWSRLNWGKIQTANPNEMAQEQRRQGPSRIATDFHCFSTYRIGRPNAAETSCTASTMRMICVDRSHEKDRCGCLATG